MVQFSKYNCLGSFGGRSIEFDVWADEESCKEIAEEFCAENCIEFESVIGQTVQMKTGTKR